VRGLFTPHRPFLAAAAAATLKATFYEPRTGPDNMRVNVCMHGKEPLARHGKRPYRVLHVLEATVGGTREHILQVLLGLDRRCFDVSLLCSVERDPAFWSDVVLLRRSGVPVTVIPMAREIRPLRDLVALARITAHLLRQRYDLVHTHSSKAGFVGRLAARIAGVHRIWHTGHIFYFQWRAGTWTGKFYRALEWLAARWSHCIVTLSEEQRHLLIRTGVARPRRTLVIPNGVRVRRWCRLPDRAAARRALGVNEDALVVGMAARLEPQKGCEHFLRAAREVLEEWPGVEFVLVGDGRIGPRLRRLADTLGLGARLHLLGHWEDMPAFYAALDLFVLTSLWEGMPYVVLEAMACGLAVCATAVPGTREIVEPGVTGVLVPPENDRALARSIVAMLRDPARRRRMGALARRRVSERYTTEAFLARLEGAYLEDLGG